MNKLSENWFIEGIADFEHKQYVLLAYLKHVKEQFGQYFLYPEFSDLIFHHSNLLSFKEKKQLLAKAFPQKLSKIDLEKLQLVYEKKDE